MHKLAILLSLAAFAVLAPGVAAANVRGHTCGDERACPAVAHGFLGMRAARRAIAATVAAVYLPTPTITACRRRGRAEIVCSLALGNLDYSPLGCASEGQCASSTLISQTSVVFVRRIQRDRVLTWYGPGKPEGICYIADL